MTISRSIHVPADGITVLFLWLIIFHCGLPCCLSGKNPPANAGDVNSILGPEDPLEKEMATHSSILAWRIHGQKPSGSPWGFKRVRHDLATEQSQRSSVVYVYHIFFIHSSVRGYLGCLQVLAIK